MISIADSLHWYALGKKGHNHTKKVGKRYKLYENKNVTAVQNFLSNYQKYLNRAICEEQGHDWFIYVVSTGYWGYDVEQAGYCMRCGYDTHEQEREIV